MNNKAISWSEVFENEMPEPRQTIYLNKGKILCEEDIKTINELYRKKKFLTDEANIIFDDIYISLDKLFKDKNRFTSYYVNIMNDLECDVRNILKRKSDPAFLSNTVFQLVAELHNYSLEDDMKKIKRIFKTSKISNAILYDKQWKEKIIYYIKEQCMPYDDIISLFEYQKKRLMKVDK